jgi:hypothetical protein
MKASASRSAMPTKLSLVRSDPSELALASCGDGPDARMVALVKALARQAAQDLHSEHMREHLIDRS